MSDSPARSRTGRTPARHRRALEHVREAIVRRQPLADMLRAVTERLGRTLDIDRTSLWTFDPEGGASRCLERWDNRLGRHAADGAVPPLLIDLGLRAQLTRELCLAVSDVEHDARVTAPMREYFAARDIGSCLYALVSLPGRAIGVLAFATVSRRWKWTLDDRALARSAADLIAYGFLLDSYREALAEQRAREDERRRLEEQLRRAGKMEAIGRLAGGIAHDFNNMVGGILGFASFLREDLPPGSTEAHFAERIVQICTRAQDVVRQILAFARADPVERAPIELRGALAASQALLSAELPPRVELELDVGRAPLTVLFNAGQLHQLLLNLSMNAGDAFEGRAGSITIRLDAIGPDHADRARFAGAPREPGVAEAVGGTLDPARGYAAVRVVDDGGGMDQATLDLAFEPFFTTKRRRHGTGLGLAVVHGILQSSGGAYAVRSWPGVGTEFSIYLPLEGRAPAEPADGVAPASVDGTERLLIVDDEPDLTDVLTIGFARLGYDVAVCNDALEALARFEADAASWDAVIVDQLMPAMTGTTLVGHLKRVRPDCPVVLCSGLHDGTTERAARAAGADAFLAKPVEPRQLAGTVRALLGRPGRAAEA